MRSQKHHHYSGIVRGRYNPRLLPNPHAILNRLNITFGKTNAYGYWTLHCPFHDKKKESKSTLRLHHIDGHYYCTLCGAEGENILGFYMESTGKNYLEATTTLKAWECCR